MNSQCEPDDFDPGGCLERVVANDEVSGSIGRLCCRSAHRRRRRSSADNASRIRGKFTRRSLSFSFRNVQEANDKELLVFVPAIWLRIFRAAAGVETKVASTILRSSTFGPAGH